MNTPSNAMPEFLGSQPIAPAVLSATRPLYWSIRRELWENRYLYVAPLAVAAVFLFAFAIGYPAHRSQPVDTPYDIASGLIMGTAFLIGLFYCLEALHSERRDRSILFWKSLPVSDRITVLAKMSILLALQLFAWAVTAATHMIMLLLSTAVLLASGQSVTTLWQQVSWGQMSAMVLYHLVTVHALWYAPIYAWLLMVSAWARRAAFLWALLPPIAIAFGEKIAFNTWHFANWLGYRFSGPQTFNFSQTYTMDAMISIDLGRFLTTPGLWFGLAFAAAFLAAAARLRRYRGPI